MRKDDSSDRLASKEMIRRELQKRALSETDQKPGGGPLITISRDFYCGGGTVAKKLAARLGWTLYDRELIDSIAADRKVAGDAIRRLDENVYPYLQEWANEIFLPGYVGHAVYMRGLARIISLIVQEGSAIVVGRGAHFLIPREKRLAVRLAAPVAWRIQNYMRATGEEHAAARDRVRQEDLRRRRFIGHNFRKDVDDPLGYDLVINTQEVEPSSVQQLILIALETRFHLTPIPGSPSVE